MDTDPRTRLFFSKVVFMLSDRGPRWGLVAALVLVLGTAFGGSGPLGAEGRVKIGFLVKMPEENWFQMEWKFAEKAGADLGFDVIKIGATDGEKVLSAIDNLAAQGARGFVICTPDVKLGPAIMAKARSHALKVIAVDDQFLGADGHPMASVPYLGISAREIGQTVGQVCWTELRRRGWNLAETGALALTFNELETARQRVAGARALLLQAGFPAAAIYDSPQKTTDVEGGFNAATVAVTKHPTIKHWLVFAINDESVLGGIQALEGRGFEAQDVIGVGINGMALAASELRKSSATGFFGSVLLDAKRHGYDTAALLYRWITSDRAPPADSRTTGIVITRDNFRQVYRANGLGELLP